VNKSTGEITYDDNKNSKKHPKTVEALKQNRKAKINFDFEFNQNQKRRFDEYDDLQIYISNKQNYLITNNERDDKDVIAEINFGIIDAEKLKIDQKTSSNVWISVLDKNLSHITNRKLDLAYFENQSYYFWMNLNAKFFFKIEEFIEFQNVNYQELSEDVDKALEEIVDFDSLSHKKKGDVK